MVYSRKTSKIAGTAILSALAIIFDYGLKFSGLKIPFPWLPFFPKFDFTGIPIALSLFLYGLPAGATASIVTVLAIVIRSGKLVSPLMKGIAEFSTIIGIAVGLYLNKRYKKAISVVFGVLLRVTAMSLTNVVVLPSYYGYPYSVTLNLLPMIGVFNAIQGIITVLIGYVLYEAFIQRVPAYPVWLSNKTQE